MLTTAACRKMAVAWVFWQDGVESNAIMDSDHVTHIGNRTNKAFLKVYGRVVESSLSTLSKFVMEYFANTSFAKIVNRHG